MNTRRISFRTLTTIAFLTIVTVVVTSFFVSGVSSQEAAIQADARPISAQPEPEKEVKDALVDASRGSTEARSSNLIDGTRYPFTALPMVALEDMSSGTTQLVGPGVDDTASVVTNIGFDFWYDGVRHSQFSVNANGLARLGSTVIGTTFDNSASGLGTTVNAPKIAPYFEDLCVGSNGKVHFKVVGSAPSRKLVVEWLNMEIPRNGSCANAVENGVFQMWLFESAGVNPGRIQFVYGAGVNPSTTDLGASIGLQSGAATNFASVTVSDDSVSYTVANNTNLPGIAAGKSYQFSAGIIPAAPTNLTFSPVTGLSIQVNWQDNSGNEVGYVIYRSTDGGATYSFLTQTAADATSFNDTGLIPGTTYFYRVHAVGEAALSSAISGSQSTNGAGSDSCAAAGGNWSDTATWADGTVPTGSDNVTIGSGCTVTVDTAGAVAFNVTINSGGTLQSPLAGAVTTNNLSVGGNVMNNGTLDFSTNANTSGAILSFVPTVPNVTFGGTGATTDIRAITVNKGAQSSVVELATSNFTVQGVDTDAAGFLTLTSGTFKISGTFAVTNRVFTAAAYTIPLIGGLWLNNPNFTVAGQNGSPTNSGLLRISSGTFNVGTASGNSMGGGAGAVFTFEGGTSNFAGRLQTTSALTYNQSGGVVNVCTVGNTATTACFGLTSTANVFNMTGGTIVLVLPNTSATPLDYSVSTAAVFTANPAGTVLQLGNMSTPAATTFRVLGAPPSVVIGAGHSLAIGSGTAGGTIFFRGSSLVNNGAVINQGTGASGRWDWAANGPMTYSGPGTFGTLAAPIVGVGMSANGGDTTLNSPIVINRVNFFTGGFINSNQITLGNGGASGTIVQVGNSSTPTAAGVFDVSPVHNAGTGGHTVLHLRTTTLNRPTGFEINPTRTLAAWTIDDNAVGGSLVVTGGDITDTGTLALTNGVVVTGANTINHDGTATRTNGFVDGNLRRNYAATGAYTYHVGKGGYSPVAASITSGTFPSSLTVRAIQGPQPNFGTPSLALQRYWTLTENGDLGANLTFTYLDPADIPVTATEANFVLFKYDGTFTMPGGTVDTTANTASITNVTSFSDWTVAEPGATATPASLQFSSATYSAAEGAGNVVMMVTRTASSTGAVGATVTFADGTATGGASCAAGIDYINTAQMVSFVDGDSAPKAVNVPICGEATIEPDETFTATLGSPTGGATIGSPSMATNTIINDDSLSGTINVGAGQTYTSLTNAGGLFEAINTLGATGNLTINITSDLSGETGTVALNEIAGGFTVLIKPTGAARTITGASTTGILKFSGADGVTIDGSLAGATAADVVGGDDMIRNLTIQNTSTTATSGAVVAVFQGTNGANNFTIKNVKVLGQDPTQTLIGLHIGGNTVGTTPAVNNNNARVENCSFRRAFIGSFMNGVTATPGTGAVITKNSYGSAVATDRLRRGGIFFFNQDGIQVTLNDIAGIDSNESADSIGIIAGNQNVTTTTTTSGGVTNANISRNRINGVKASSTVGFSAVGIAIAGGTTGPNVIANNMISGVIGNPTSPDIIAGIFVTGVPSSDTRVFFNSISLTGDRGAVASQIGGYGIAITGATPVVQLRDNIFYNTQISGGGANAKSYSIGMVANVFTNYNSNYNDFFASGANAGFFRTNGLGATGTDFATLAAFQAATAQEANSQEVDPLYVNPASDLHLQPMSPVLDDGTPAGGITVDFDGDARNATTPDIGADEIAGAAGALQFSSATYTVGEAGPTATITITRTGGTTGAVTVDYATVAGGTATGGASCAAGIDYVTTSGTASFPDGSSTSQTFNVTICQDAVFKVDETINLALTNPTGGATLGTPNTAVLTITNDDTPPFSGTINVGTGQTFTSLTLPGGLFEAINTSGASSNLTINITSDLTGENGTVALNEIAGGFTVLIKPVGAPRSITGSASGSTGAILKFNGADGVTIDGSLTGATAADVVGGDDSIRNLTIQNTNTAATAAGVVAAFQGTNGANNFTIKNTKVLGQDPIQTLLGIHVGGNTIGASPTVVSNNARIENCSIRKAILGTFTNGVTATPATGTVITKNSYGSLVATDRLRRGGIFFFNQNGIQVTLNDIAGIDSNESADSIGIIAGNQAISNTVTTSGNVSNANISRNRINGVKASSTTGFSAAGISIGGGTLGPNVVANNMITGVIGPATSPDLIAGIFVVGATSSDTRLYFNSVAMTGDRGPVASQLGSYGIAITGASPVVDLKDNIFYNTQISGGGANAKSYSIGMVASTFTNYNSDFNDFFASGANAGFFRTGGLLATGTDHANLAAFQAATGREANSKEVAPLFVDPLSNLHLQGMSPMINMGTAAGGITVDFDGDTRGASPDIGADEVPAPAPASIGGQVLTAEGAGIRNVIVSITCSCLPAPVRVYTSSFGYYNFDGLVSGQTYTVSVASKRYVFATPSVMVVPNPGANVQNFTANPQ